MPIEWKAYLETGIPIIDKQHKELFNQMQELHAACKEQGGKAAIQEIFGFLEGYFNDHFATEEKLFDEHEFPGMERHVSAHDAFKEEIHEFRKDVNERGIKAMDALKMNRILVGWLTKHIGNMDQEFAPFIKEKLGLHD